MATAAMLEIREIAHLSNGFTDLHEIWPKPKILTKFEQGHPQMACLFTVNCEQFCVCNSIILSHVGFLS